ncbi:glycosyltransferase family 2 protein [Candidatus Pacearchaeota archaeon]|nr:glycosyltransferase family 2 protein [Candidatus Pacearchaeota archaeon]
MKSLRKQPLVGIIIVNWNKKEMTAECLNSLKKTTYKNYKVILIDNGSTDGSVEYLKKINPKMAVIKLKRNYGYTEGTNVGWKYAMKKMKADYICVMDNDIVTVQPQWLDLIMNELVKSPKNGLGSGKHTFPDGRLQTPYVGADASYKKDTGKYDFVKEVEAFVGPAMVISRAVIEKIGFYDENFFYGPNDLDFCFRARKAGFKIIYNGKSHSVHIGSASGLSPAKDYIYRHQSEGMMIYSFRYGSIGEKLGMALRQLSRALFTRRITTSPISFRNTIIHWTFPKRLVFYTISLYHALLNYKKVKTSDEPEKISGIE